jgi:dGTPase
VLPITTVSITRWASNAYWSCRSENPVVHDEFVKAQRILRDLWAWCLEDAARFERRAGLAPRAGETAERAVTDWLSGMTDRFALATWEGLFVPRPWGQP